jgi:hypothetical protein
MIVLMYVFDTSSLIVLFSNFYLKRFPSLWEKFDALLADGRILLVRETYREIERYNASVRLVTWAKENRELFTQASREELQFVNDIFAVPHFQLLIGRKKILSGQPVADPFVIARAKVADGVVVTQEQPKGGTSAKIPDVCKHFGIGCTNLEGFMEREGWQF